MPETNKNSYNEIREVLIGLLWEESGKLALKKIFDDNPFMAVLAGSEEQALSENFAMITYSLADSDEERALYEVLATKYGLNALVEFLKIDADLVDRLDLNYPGNCLDEDWQPPAP